MAQLWRAQVSGGAAIWAAQNGDGTPSTPTIGTITPTADGCVFTHSGGGTHYRVFVLAGSPGSWVSLGSSPVTLTGLTVNTEYTLQISGDGSTVADAENWGTLNPGSGSGEPTVSGISGDGAAVLRMGAALGTGAVRVAGTGSAVIRRATQAAAGSVRVGGTGVATLARALSVSAGGVRVSGSGAAVLSRVTQVSAGIVGAAPIIGSGDAVLRLSGSASGSVRVSGAGSAVLGLVAAASGAVTGAAAISGVGFTVLRVLGDGLGTVTGEGSSITYAPQPETSSSWSYQQTATLWRLTAPAGWGTPRTFAAPVLFLCDYMREGKTAVNARGDEFMVKLTAYTSLPGIKPGDMVLIGINASADPVSTDAEEVQAVVSYGDTFNAGGAEDFKILA
jgi:hypothetical protein